MKPEPAPDKSTPLAGEPAGTPTRPDVSQTLSDGSKTVGDASATPLPQGPPPIPDHELLYCAGRGSYGEVWLARNVMGLYRAVKIVHRSSFEHARPFEREFNGIKKFEPISRSHDGFVDILQVGRTEDYFYYVMELADDVVSGQQIDPLRYEAKTLRSEIGNRRKLPFEKCVEVGLSLAAALGHLHKHGLIHRDIKPSNIIFVNGQPKLADIGLVAEQSEAKSFVGTEGFIPPEGPGTSQADIYSLGKVLYEIATGKDRHEFPALPTALGETKEDDQLLELNTVFLKACQNDIHERYQTCEQMRDDLLLLRSGESVAAAQELRKRLARLYKLSAVGMALTLVLLGGAWFFKRQAARETALRADAQRNLYGAEMNLAFLALRENLLHRVDAFLERHRPARNGLRSDGQGAADPAWEWRYLWEQTRADHAYALVGHTNIVTRMALSPDGALLASTSFDKTLRIWDLRARKELHRFKTPERLYSVDWSPDGRWVAAVGRIGGAEGSLWLYETNTWSHRQIANKLNTLGVAFSPDSTLVAAIGIDGLKILSAEVRVCQVADGKEIFRTQASNRLILPTGIRFVPERSLQVLFDSRRPTGPVLAFGSNGDVVFVDLHEHREILRFSNPVTGIQDLDFSPDGRFAATAGYTGGVQVWDLAARRTITNLWPRSGLYGSARFSPSGNRLAVAPGTSGGQETDVTPWMFRTADWSEIRSGQPHRSPRWDLLFTRDGRELLGSGESDGRFDIRAWPVESAEPVPRTSGVGNINNVFSPDDKFMLNRPAIGGEGPIRIHDTRDFSETNRFRFHIRDWTGMTLMPGGQQLVVSFADGRMRLYDLPKGTAVSNSSQTTSAMAGSEMEAPVVGPAFLEELKCDPSARVTAPVVSKDGRRIAAQALGLGMCVWQRGQTDPIATIPMHESTASRWILSAKGNLLAIGYADGTVELWDVAAGRKIINETRHSDSVSELIFAEEDSLLVSCDYAGPIFWWNTRTGQLLQDRVVDTIYGSSVALSPDGTRIACGRREVGGILLWDGNTHVQVGQLDCPGPVYRLAWSPDGNSLCAMHLGGQRLFRAASPEAVRAATR
ncbi:MAG: protein kinase [Verrucomicrobia bacterium]|nr:protein kinase [Verrucomicrobiota bacterium]